MSTRLGVLAGGLVAFAASCGTDAVRLDPVDAVPVEVDDSCGELLEQCCARDVCTRVVKVTNDWVTLPCEAGACVCPMLGDRTGRLTACGETCVDTRSDRDNCGACGIACTVAGMSCQAGRCTCGVDEDGTEIGLCDGECADTRHDDDNCGACGVECIEGAHCEDGACACRTGEALCGECIDVQSDPRNCGGCGAVCATDAPSVSVCAAGTCVVTLAEGWDNDLYCLVPAVDATSVYWASSPYGAPGSGTVARIAIGGGLPTTIASGQSLAGGVAVDGTSVYWLADGAVLKAPIAGGAPFLLAWGQAYSGCHGIAVDATSVYWSSDGEIMKAPVGGGPSTLLASEGALGGIALDATNVYWIAHDPQQALTNVRKVPLAGGVPTTLATTPGSVLHGSVAVDATSVYWAAGKEIMKVPIAGGVPNAIASSSLTIHSVAFDAKNVYAAHSAYGFGVSVLGLFSVPLGGGGQSALPIDHTTGFQGNLGFASIALDATSVYWTDSGGQVARLTPK